MCMCLTIHTIECSGTEYGISIDRLQPWSASRAPSCRYSTHTSPHSNDSTFEHFTASYINASRLLGNFIKSKRSTMDYVQKKATEKTTNELSIFVLLKYSKS